FAVTLTGSYSVDNLTIKPELRLDSASDDSFLFLDSDLAPQKSLSSFVLAAIYSF
ncbi:MAG: outer membrane beta-barrel protein, partial [Maribacter sp.]|nr:outer membrane beta-barrel protein [Maribacter sp.]